MTRMRRWLPWMALAVMVAVALVVAAGSGSKGAQSETARAARLDAQIRCPTCKGLSAAESDAEAARAIRAEVAKEVHEGRSDGAILSSIAGRYGSDILLRPSASGFDELVWVLPVAAFVVAIAGLALAFRRWHRSTVGSVTDADRAVVAEARGR